VIFSRDWMMRDGKPVPFLHPKDFFGTLVELEEV
jgi:hypothetical protein